MNQSATLGVTAQGQIDHYHRWVDPDGGIIVCLQFETADRLRIDMLDGVDAFAGDGEKGPSGAAEAGGILLGRTEVSQGRLVIFVDDFEPVSCEHRNGLSYALTSRDLVNFEAALHRGEGKTQRVVGYYRTHHRDGLWLSPDDMRLIQKHFRAPDNLFLLIKTLPDGKRLAGLFFWKDGIVQSQPIVKQAEAAMADVPDPAPADDFRRRVLRSVMFTSAAAALTLAIVRAPHGPRAIHGKDGTTVPVAVVPAAAAPTTAASTASVPRAAATASATPVIPMPVHAAPLPDSRKAAATIRPAEIPAGPATTEAAAPRPPLASAPVPEETASVPPPQAAPPAVTPPPVQPPVTTEPKLAAPTPAVVSAPPSTPQTVAPPSLPAPAPAPAAARTLTGPEIIHQATPAVPRAVRSMITSDVQVDVAVSIDAKGKVVTSRVVSTRGAAAGQLTIEALKAAQLFRFRPARDGDRNVASSMVLTFRFGPTGH